MKKALLTSLGALMIVGAANAATPYASLKFGFASVKAEESIPGLIAKWDAIGGWTGAIAGGAAFAVDPMLTIRGELEYSRTSVEGRAMPLDPRDTKITDNAILLNGFADLGGTQWGGFNPYVGLHLGYAWGEVDFSPSFSPDIKGGIAYGASIGAAYSITNNIAIDLGVRYLTASRSYNLPNGFSVDFETNQLSVLLGARYMF